MGLMYTVTQRNFAVTAACDIFEIVNAAVQSIVVHQIRLTCNNTADERLNLALVSRSTTGSGGSATVVPLARDTGNARASGITSFKTNVTTPGTLTNTYEADIWSELAPYEYIWTPETRFKIPSAISRLCLHNADVPAASRNFSLTVTWEENV